MDPKKNDQIIRITTAHRQNEEKTSTKFIVTFFYEDEDGQYVSVQLAKKIEDKKLVKEIIKNSLPDPQIIEKGFTTNLCNVEDGQKYWNWLLEKGFIRHNHQTKNDRMASWGIASTFIGDPFNKPKLGDDNDGGWSGLD